MAGVGVGMAGVEDGEEVVTEAPLPNRSGSRKNSKTKKKVTIPKPFNLSLSKRMEERQHYRSEMDRKQKESEEREKRLMEEEKEEEKKELKVYRRSLVHKATPIRKYRDFAISPSDKELTCPIAPNLITDNRSSRKINNSGDNSLGDSISPGLINSEAPV